MVVLVRLNSRGFSLVEMLVAMAIILVLLLSLVQAALLTIDGNMRNLLRDEGVRIAEQRMNGMLVDKGKNGYQGLRDTPFDHLYDAANSCSDPPIWTCTPVVSSLRNLTKEYSVCWSTCKLSHDVLNLKVAVGWDHKNELPSRSPTGREYQQTISSILRR